MKFLIASDIHGSALFCEQLLAVCKRENADRLLLLGDLLTTARGTTFPADTPQNAS